MNLLRFLADAAVSFSFWYSSPPPAPPAETVLHVEEADPDLDVDPMRGVMEDARSDVESILSACKRSLTDRGASEATAHDSVERILAGVKAEFGFPGSIAPPIATRAERDAIGAITRALRGHKGRLASMRQAATADPAWKARIAGLDNPPPEPTTPHPAEVSRNVYASPQSPTPVMSPVVPMAPAPLVIIPATSYAIPGPSIRLAPACRGPSCPAR